MLMAQLRGKVAIHDWATKEDLLTSAVLGVLKNSAPAATAQLLSLATSLRGKSTITLSSKLAWEFWPRWESELHSTIIEPDVVIEDSGNLVVIEAKLYSDFGSGETAASPLQDDQDFQLQREWTYGLLRATRDNKKLSLLAITNHATLPYEVMDRQLSDDLVDRTQVYWLSWLQISRFLNECEHPEMAGWCQDLHELFTIMGLASFEGFDRPPQSWSCACLWTDRVIFEQFRTEGVGFGPSVRLAKELGSWSLSTLSLSSEIEAGTEDIGFAVSTRLARELDLARLHDAWSLRLPLPTISSR